MKIAFIVNDVKTEKDNYTTVLLAQRMHLRGHDVFLMGVGDLTYFPDGRMGGLAWKPDNTSYKTGATFLRGLRSEGTRVHVYSDELDMLMLRNDPADEPESRAWARIAGLNFGQYAVSQGVMVLNDPFTLSNSLSKLYFQHFPEAVRPRTIITRNREDILAFFEEQNDDIILKPLQGSGGHNVFIVKKNDTSNLNQIVEVICREGYVVAQEYLPKAKDGDTRVFLMNGNLLEFEGKCAMLRRVNQNGDIRSNISAGGHVARAKCNDTIRDIAEAVRPKLIEDGIFLAGLDIVGDKLMEVNVFSPGGLNVISRLEEVDFTIPVIDALEAKCRQREKTELVDNRLLNTL